MSNRAINITVSRCCNVRGSRSPVAVLVRIDHGDTSLKASAKFEQVDGVVDVQHSVVLECPGDMTPDQWLDHLISRPLVFTLQEVVSAGKDKRGGGGAGSKEEKTTTIGQCCVDLLSVLNADEGMDTCTDGTSMSLTVLSSGPESPIASQPGGQVCTMDVEVRVGDGFDDVMSKGSRVMHACVDALYAPPAQWANGGVDITYAAGLPLPAPGQKYNTVLFSGGTFQPPQSAAGKGSAADVKPSIRHWNISQPAAVQCAGLPTSQVQDVLLDEEDGELHVDAEAQRFRGKGDRGQRVDWFAESRAFVPDSSVNEFYAALREQTLWPVEVMRVQSVPVAPTKGKRLSAAQEVTNDYLLSYHGVAYVDLAPLLYPGCTTVHGVYRIHPFNESEVLSKTGRKANVGEILVQQGGGVASDRLKSATQKKRTTSTSKLPAIGDDSSAVKSLASESAAYSEKGTYIKLQITLNRPLVACRPLQSIEEDISVLLRRSEQDEGHALSSESTTTPLEELNKKLKEIAMSVKQTLHHVVNQRMDRLEKESRAQKGYPGEKRVFKDVLCQPDLLQLHQEDLHKELASSGVYGKLQDQLRLVVIAIIRDKFGHISATRTEHELQQLLPRIHMFIAQEINRCVTEWGSKQQLEREPTILPLTSSSYLLFAREAESEKHWKMASRYYQKCIELDRTPDNLFENAKFSIVTGDQQAAFCNLMAAIALQMDHIPSLLLYAMLSAIHGHTAQAALFLEAAVEYDNPVFKTMPRVLLGLLHDMSGDIVARDHTFRDARRRARTVRDAQAREEAAANKGSSANVAQPTIDVTAASSQTSSATAKNVSRSKGVDGGAALTTSQVSVRSSISKADSQGPLAGSTSQSSIATKTPRRNDLAASSKSALATPTRASASDKPSLPEVTVSDESERDVDSHMPWLFLEVAMFAISCHTPHFAALALNHHLTTHGASQEYYIAMARLCMEREQYTAAEECVQNALRFGYENAEVWAISGHLRYLQGAAEAARGAFERSVNLVDRAKDEHIVYLRLGNVYLSLSAYARAKWVFLLACKQEKGSARAWLGVGKACYRLGSLQEAEAALLEANALNREEPEVWAYLSLVSLKCNRRLPAERTFQYALKTGLRDGPLAHELASLQAEKGFGDGADVLTA